MEPTAVHRRSDAAAEAATFDALVGPWTDEMYRIAAAIVCQGEAQDVTQDALLDAWRGFSSLRDPARVRPWLHAVVANRCRKQLRARRSRPRLIAVDPPEGVLGDRAAGVAERDRLDRAFESLSADQRIAVVLHHVADLSVPQIAAALAVPEGTVKSRVNAGLGRLRAAIEREDDR